MKLLRVLFVNEYCGYWGGVEQYIFSVATGLRELGHECHLVYGKRVRDAEAFASVFHSTVQSAEAGGTDQKAIIDVAAELQADAVFVHKIPSLPDSLLMRKQVRVIRMIHDHEVCCPRHHKYYTYNQRICNKPHSLWCWADAAFLMRDKDSFIGFRLKFLPAHKAEMKCNWLLDHLLVGSEFMKAELLMNGCPPEKVDVLPPVVSEKSHDTRPPGPGENGILFVGQLIRGKGVDLLLHALVLLQSPCDAIIVGDGNARIALEELTEALALKEQVRFTGWVPNDELQAYYSRARVVAMPCRWPEPFGIVGLEAMRHARPVVAFRAGGVPDWLIDGETGILVNEQDIAGFAEALDRLLKDAKMAQAMGQKAHDRATTHYCFQNTMRQLEQYLAGGIRQQNHITSRAES